MRLFADDSFLFVYAKGINQIHKKMVKDLQTVSHAVFNPLI